MQARRLFQGFLRAHSALDKALRLVGCAALLTPRCRAPALSWDGESNTAFDASALAHNITLPQRVFGQTELAVPGPPDDVVCVLSDKRV